MSITYAHVNNDILLGPLASVLSLPSAIFFDPAIQKPIEQRETHRFLAY
jgi:hypothetical protein